MRLILVFLTVFELASCTTHQEISKSIEESNRILKERAEGAKKISDAKANFNPHKIMEIKIPKPKKKAVVPTPPAPVIEKKVPDIFDTTPNGMVKDVSYVR